MKKFASKKLTEEFWNDCFNNKKNSSFESSNKNSSYNNYCKNIGRNKKNDQNKNKYSNNSKNLFNIYSFQNQSKDNQTNLSKSKSKNKTIDNSNISKIYKKHPFIYKITKKYKEEIKEKEEKKKNALIRCLGLYAYGIEVQKEKMLNEKNHKDNRIKQEILKCTFKPKINKSSYSKKAKFLMHFVNKNKNNNDENNINIINKISSISSYNNDNNITSKNDKDIKTKNNKKNINKEEKVEKFDEYTFRPKTIRLNIKSVFRRPKSIDNEKNNYQFVWRYNKARENYMIKKIKKTSTRDESYETMLISFYDLTNRFKNNNYYNYNQYMNYQKENDLDNKRNITPLKNIVNNLRQQLLKINLNNDDD